jgi:hypothetical protein
MLRTLNKYRVPGIPITGVDPLGIIAKNVESKYIEIGDWKEYLLSATSKIDEQLMQHERTGRPLGSNEFIEKVGLILGRDLKKKNPGPKPKLDS